MSPASSPSLPELLADARWVRALARSLAVDVDDADDLAQDACLLALRQPPGRDDNLRGWFARVLGNLVRQRRRADHRRTRREAGAGGQRPATAAATDDLVERANTHRAVVDAVLALDEPYRATILLRFFEDLPPRAIAARMGVPVATVHTRLQRGCERLRQRLDTTFGRRGVWCAAVLPLPRLAVTIPLGVLAMKGKSVAVVAAVVAGASALWLGSTWLGAAGTPANAEREAPSVATAPLTQAPPVSPATEAERVEVTAKAPAAAPAAVAAATTQLRGQLVDGDGRSVPGVQLALRTDAPPGGTYAENARSDATGAFSFDVRIASEGRIVAAEPGWQTVMSATVSRRQALHRLLVVAARAVALAGHVRGADGRPLAGARVQVVWPGDLRARWSHISDAAAEEDLSARSGAAGEFTLTGANVRGALLVTTADGHVPDRRALPELDERALEITLQPMVGKPGTLEGQVVDQKGMPVAGARVALGRELVRSDERGGFLVDDDGKGPTLVAAFAGHRRAVVERGAGFAPFVVLELGAPPLTIRGRVVDESGKGLEGLKVWVADATLLADRQGPDSAEGVAGGCTSTEDLLAAFRRGELRDPEATLRSTPTTGWPWVRTDHDGAFTLTGLEDRPYVVRAMDERTLLMVDRENVAAGSAGVEIVLPQSDLFAAVAGRVVSHSGEPVAGVRVFVQNDPQRLGGSTAHNRVDSNTTTDTDGRFELSRVPKRRVYLRLEGESILPLEYGRGVAGGLLELSRGDAMNLRVEVSVRRHVQVELADPAGADELAVLDAAGKQLIINVFSGRGRRETDMLQLSDGRSPVFVVPDTAATLILRRQEKEVARHPLVLRAGDVNTLRF